MFYTRLILTLIVFFMTAGLIAQTGYYRYPTQQADNLVFASEGDLWLVSATGGDAVRLTSHPETESHAFISPNGEQLAFMASYDGSFEVYVMPVSGGKPLQITHTGGALRGWTADGRLIVTRTREIGIMDRVVEVIDPKSGSVEQLPLLNANHATMTDDNQVIFTRYGLETSRDNSRMYRGGTMSQLWSWRKGADEAERLAEDFDAPIKYPMVAGGRIWFTTDKSGYDNIWSMNMQGSDAKQHTTYKDFGIKNPQLTDAGILYQQGADIHRFDPASGNTSKISITLVGDEDRKRLRWVGEPMEGMSSANLAMNGDRVAITSRGQVTIATNGPLRRIDLDIPAMARARTAVMGADDEWVYVLLEQGERGEIWRFPANGTGSAEQITRNSDARIWDFQLSPDGKWLVYHDNARRLWLKDLDSRKKRLVDTENNPGDGGFGDFVWSGSGDWLAYSHGVSGVRGQISVYDIKSKKLERLTSAKYSSSSPAFSADDKWLYFVSERYFATSDSVWRDRMMGPSFNKRANIFALALDASAQFPFTETDELIEAKEAAKEAEAKKAKDKSKDNKKKSKDKSGPKIDWDGLAERLYQVPVGNGDYSDLAVTDSHLYVLDDPGRGPGTLKVVEITNDEPELETFAGGVNWFELSADGEQMLFAKRGPGDLFVVDTGPKAPKDLGDYRLRTDDWTLAIEPQLEWQQMFHDAWRMHRDFSFDKNMRGVDWKAVKAKLLPLVERIGDRTELNDVLAYMASDLGILHSQVRSGDLAEDYESAEYSTLGGIFEAVKGGLKLSHIYQGEPGVVTERGPLSGPDKDIQVGDVLSHVNGAEVSNHIELKRALANQTNQQVLLTFKRKSKVHDVIVKPVNMWRERMMRYNDWVESKTNYVSEQADDIGYLHIRAMGGGDAANFARDFYALTEKDGLIIDVRANRGGNIDSWLLSTLLRKVWAFWHFNANPTPYGNMQQTFRGHLVVLFNQYTYSDGETFSAGFKAMDLGHSIGTRTAGAGIWLSDRNRLADNGGVRIAESGQFDINGNWAVEGWGVGPDQEVVNMPVAAYKGQDAQLDAALKYLKAKIKAEPIPEFKAGPIHPVGKPAADVN